MNLSAVKSSQENTINSLKAAGKLANEVLAKLSSLCIPDAKVADLCKKGDELLNEKCRAYALKHQAQACISFPTCISIDEVICHFSPSSSYETLDICKKFSILRRGSLIKIELGIAVDNWPVVVGHSMICGVDGKTSVDDINVSTANVLLAAYVGNLRAVKSALNDGYEGAKLDESLRATAKEFAVIPVQGALSYQVDHGTLDGPKQIPLNVSEKESKMVEKFKFQIGDIFVVDSVMTTGDGMLRQLPIPTTIFRRTPQTYNFKLNASKAVFNEIKSKHGYFPFHIRTFADERKAQLGLIEPVKHQVICQSEILSDREYAKVARFISTVVITEKGPISVAAPAFSQEEICRKAIKNAEAARVNK